MLNSLKAMFQRTFTYEGPKTVAASDDPTWHTNTEYADNEAREYLEMVAYSGKYPTDEELAKLQNYMGIVYNNELYLAIDRFVNDHLWYRDNDDWRD